MSPLLWGRAGMHPGLRTSFPVLLFTVHLACPPDGNFRTTHRSQHRTPHPYAFFHRGFLTLHRCYFLAGPGEETWRAERTLRVPGPGGEEPPQGETGPVTSATVSL